MMQPELPNTGQQHFTNHQIDQRYGRHSNFLMDQPISGLHNGQDTHHYASNGAPQYGAPHQPSRGYELYAEDGTGHNDMMYAGTRGTGEHNPTNLNQPFVTP